MTVEAYAELAGRVSAAPRRLGRTRLVAVDGPSGAGKTVFADRLARAVHAVTGEITPVVHTDDLLDGWADQVTFWSRLETRVLGPLRRGESGRFRAYDWRAGAYGEEWVTVPPAPVVVLDGVSTGRAEIRPELTLVVFVVGPDALRRQRVLERDGDAVSAYLDDWRRGEERHFAADRTADHADLVVDGAPSEPHDPLTHYIRR